MTPWMSVGLVARTLRLACNRVAGHSGLHAELNDGEAIARWPVLWTGDDDARVQDRLAWHKPHVRRTYETLAMWRARQ
jgi:hypothetical protein